MVGLIDIQRSRLHRPISKIRMILLMDAKIWMTSSIIMFAVRPIFIQDSIFKMSSDSPGIVNRMQLRPGVTGLHTRDLWSVAPGTPPCQNLQPGSCITNVIATCRKNFSQWHRSFQRKLRSHWLKIFATCRNNVSNTGPWYPLYWRRRSLLCLTKVPAGQAAPVSNSQHQH